MRIVMFQCCYLLGFGMLAGYSFNIVLEQRVAQREALLLVNLPLTALNQINVGQHT